jgi:hypothetical protein
MANDTQYGLASSVYTENIRTAHRMIRKLQAGQVSVNSAGDVSNGLPFGGYKVCLPESLDFADLFSLLELAVSSARTLCKPTPRPRSVDRHT